MKLCFATLGCPDWDMATIVAQARGMGYDGVELRGAAGNHIGPDEPAESRRAIRERFAGAGVAIACIGAYTNFATTDAGQREQSVAQMAKMIDVAGDVGCPTVRIFGGEPEDGDMVAAIARAARCVSQVTGQAGRRGVRLALETHDAWCRGADAAALVKAVGSPAFGVCWDVCNSYHVEPPEKTAAAVGSHVIHVHFKDARHTADGKEHPTLPGTGDVDLRRCLGEIRRIGYDGWLSFEWEKKWVAELAPPEVALPHYVRVVRGLLAGE